MKLWSMSSILRRLLPTILTPLCFGFSVRGATPVHVFDAASTSNLKSGLSLTQWSDVGPGFSYGGTLRNININNASGLVQTAGFSTSGTLLTASFDCAGANSSGGKPQGQAQNSSIGNGLQDGSVEIWFRTDLSDADRTSWQVLWESGASTNGFSILLRTNGIFPAEMRVLKSWSSSKIVDMTIELPGFGSGDFIQAVATFDGDTVTDGNDAVRLFVRDAAGAIARVDDTGNDFESLAGSNDSCVFNAANENSFGIYGSCGGNVGNAIAMSGFKGEIALINVYATAMSAAEVVAAYQAIADLGDDDGDGMTNVWELGNGLNPNSAADAAQDVDSDGLDNLGEFDAGTNPNAMDTDGDGLNDGAEISLGANPLLTDSDGDGLEDGDEVTPNPHVTSPVNVDTDGDLVRDPLELMVGSDPQDPGSTGMVLISEFMASNGFSLDDEDGDNSDWIEIVNATGSPVSVGGMFLTDDALNLPKWGIPAGLVLQPNEFLVVFASGKDRRTLGQELHTNFVLAAGGDYLALVASNGATIRQEFSPQFPGQKSDISYGFDALYLTASTPGEVNAGPGVTGFVADTKFSIDRGFYTSPITVEITTASPGAMIVYTTDSSTPTLSNGTLVPGPLALVNIAATMVLRAAAFKDDLAPTNVDTHTYVFAADVVTQSDNPNDYEYANWNNLTQSRNADYGMDQSAIVGVLYSHEEVISALQSLPTISIATDAAQLFDQQVGNYANSKLGGMDWEREISMEFFGFAHGQDRQINGGLRLAGNASRNANRHKHNMRVAFRREYGDGTLSFPLFADSKVTTFNSIQLRGGNGDSWANPGVRDRATYLRDQWHRDIHIAMGGPSQAQMYAHLYLNGMYWGVFHVFERIEDDYMVEHFGGTEADWDVRDHISAFDGSETAWTQARAIADDALGMASPPNYEAIQQHLDLPTFIDWLLVHFYSNSDDWDQNNIRMGRNRVTPDTWKFFCWDQERTLLNTLSSPTVNGAVAINKNTNTNTRKGPTHVHQRLLANPEYEILFADRVRKHCFHGGPLTPAGANAAWDLRAAETREAMIAESARWGDLHGTAKTPTDWEARVALEKSGWFDIRTPILIGLLQTRGLYPNTGAPEYEIDGTPQHGGPTLTGAQLGMTAPSGTIYYTLDGSDPRMVGGSVSGSLYSAPIPLTTPVIVKARVLAGGEWSALTETFFSVGVQASAGNLVLSEIMYHPAGDPGAEYIEVRNILAVDTIDLSGVKFVEGLEYEFPLGLTLPAGESYLVVRDLAAFSAIHGAGLAVVGVFANNTALENAGERIVLEDAGGGIIRDFSYDDEGGWPEGPDGGAPSLVLINPTANPDHGDPASWRSSVSGDGSPGVDESTPFASWSAIHGVLTVREDLDRDGLSAGIEYALGSDPNTSDPGAHPQSMIVEDAGTSYLAIEIVRTPGRDEGAISVEVSNDLISWSGDPAEFVLISNQRNPDGTETLIYRATTPLGNSGRQFLRMVVAFGP